MYQGVATMSGSGPAMMSPGVMPERSDSEIIDTRFGKVTIYRTNPIVLPNGMLGQPDKNQFCLTNFPSEKMARFKLLQSLDDTALSFITLPVEASNPIVERADMEQASRDLNIPLDQLVTLFVVSVHREAGAVKLSVNARAPIMLDAVRRVATQHVFHNAKYQIRQPLFF